MVLKYCDLFNQAADQRLVIFCDGGRLALDEILQVPDLLHLLIFDDAIHLGLPALIPEPENLIRDSIVIIFLIDLLQELLLQFVQPFIYDLRREGITLQDHCGDVRPQRLQEIILLAKHPVDGVDDHLLQKCFIHGPVVAGMAGGLQAAAAPPHNGLTASVVPVDASVKLAALAAENDLRETVLAGVAAPFAIIAGMYHAPADQLLLYQKEDVLRDDSFVVALHIVLRNGAVVFDALLCQEVRGVGLLQERVTDVFLVVVLPPSSAVTLLAGSPSLE